MSPNMGTSGDEPTTNHNQQARDGLQKQLGEMIMKLSVAQLMMKTSSKV